MSLIRHTGRHRKPRRSRATQLLRGGVLSGLLGTVAVSAPAGAAEVPGTPAEEPPAETTAELPVLDGVLTAGADQAAQATDRYAYRAVVEHAHARAVSQAEEAAAAYRAERERAAEEARAAEAAAARAAEERAAEERAAEEAAASRDAARTETLSAAPDGTAAEPSETTSAPASGVNAAVDFARSQIGAGYALGANGPDAWDCSSLTQAAYGQAGISLPRTAEEQSALGTEVSLDQLQPGDLLYWGSRGSAYHVAVYVGDGRFVGAQNPSTGTVERDLDWDMPTGAVRL